ncbi:hypothetical protein FRC18_002331 [Serendipita sp. 400]|nr:hypothetical protein FRC18_002331 [Serendipita sp. 400]
MCTNVGLKRWLNTPMTTENLLRELQSKNMTCLTSVIMIVKTDGQRMGQSCFRGGTRPKGKPNGQGVFDVGYIPIGTMADPRSPGVIFGGKDGKRDLNTLPSLLGGSLIDNNLETGYPGYDTHARTTTQSVNGR